MAIDSTVRNKKEMTERAIGATHPYSPISTNGSVVSQSIKNERRVATSASRHSRGSRSLARARVGHESVSIAAQAHPKAMGVSLMRSHDPTTSISLSTTLSFMLSIAVCAGVFFSIGRLS